MLALKYQINHLVRSTPLGLHDNMQKEKNQLIKISNIFILKEYLQFKEKFKKIKKVLLINYKC